MDTLVTLPFLAELCERDPVWPQLPRERAHVLSRGLTRVVYFYLKFKVRLILFENIQAV